MSKTLKNLSFEEAMAELEEIAQALEEGKDSLEKSMELYERASLLRRFCEEKLTEAESKWTVLKKTPEGKVEAKPLKKEEIESSDQGSMF